MAELPPAAWRERTDMPPLLAALGDDGGDRCRWVGGCVRDGLLGLPVADLDMATVLAPDAVMAALAAAGIRALPTGIAHGTVTALLPGGPVEITTLRRDVSTDGRRAVVAFSTDWREDAARRDFTINALYAEPRSGRIHDYHGGLADLAARRVRFIGDAEARIREDHLRILRYFRFAARFGDAPDAEAEAACAALAPSLRALSRERVAGELLRLLALPDPVPVLRRMRALGVWPHLLPEIAPGGEDALARRLAAAPEPGRLAPLTRLVALLPPDAGLADRVAARLRLSNAQRDRAARLAGIGALDLAGVPALAHRHGAETAIQAALLRLASEDLPAALAMLDGWQPPVFAVKGGDVLAFGIAAGPAVAAVLQATERRWIAEGFPGPERQRALLAEEVRARA